MDRIADVLDKLAEKLGVTVQYLWPYLVKQTQINWIAGFVACFLCVGVLTFIAYRLYKKAMSLKDKDGDGYRWGHEDGSYPWFCAMWGAIVFDVFAFAGLVLVLADIASLIVPEAATVSRLLRAVR